MYLPRLRRLRRTRHMRTQRPRCGRLGIGSTGWYIVFLLQTTPAVDTRDRCRLSCWRRGSRVACAWASSCATRGRRCERSADRSRQSPTQAACRSRYRYRSRARGPACARNSRTSRGYLTTLKKRERRIDLNHSATPSGDQPPYAGSRDHHTMSARPLTLS